MNPKLTLYSRKDCCLCDEMKAVVREIAAKIPLEIVEIDVDGTLDLRDEFGAEVPVLFIDGRKAFKYRVTARELERHLNKENRSRTWLRFSKGDRCQ
ncbi:MAG TPA: glutaredoxin family protein [Candidatus Binatia bacterium]